VFSITNCFVKVSMTYKMTNSRTCSPSLPLLAALAVFVAPLLANAQENGLIEAFGSRLRLGNDPGIGGLSVSGYSGPFGLRLSGAINLRSDDEMQQVQTSCRGRFYCDSYSYGDPFAPAVGAWSYDADLIFAPFRKISALRSLVLGFSPYAFVGIGRSAVLPTDGADTARTSVSYGLGAYRALFGRLGVSGEARYRRPVQGDSTLTVGTGREWEYRFGLSIRLGASTHHGPIVVEATVPIDTDAVAARRAEEAAMLAESRARVSGRVLDAAEELIGTSYRHGGTSPSTGFDAAGFVQYLYGREGFDLPGTARGIAQTGESVPLREDALAPGDLLIFANDGVHVDHVAIYVGHDRIVHATESGGGVRFDVLGEGMRGRWFYDHLVTARRLFDGRPTTPKVDEGRDPPDAAPRRVTPPESSE